MSFRTVAHKMESKIDLISFDSWDFSAQDTATTTTTSEECSLSTAPSMEMIFEQQTETAAPRSNNIQVSVSGVIFLLNPKTFSLMEMLPWTWNSATSMYSLTTSPVLFELLLNFIMFGSKPVLTELSKSDIEELEPLALLLGLQEFHQHLKKPRILLRAGSFGRRRSSVDKKPVLGDNSSPPMLIRKIQTVMNRTTKEPRKMTHAELMALTDRMQ